jgi:D-arabinitol dehydrogenase (NADP+)
VVLPGASDYSGSFLTSGLILAQLLKLNGASKVVVAAHKGVKMDIARKLHAADEYVEIDRDTPEGQWAQLKKNYAYGFDAVASSPGHSHAGKS